MCSTYSEDSPGLAGHVEHIPDLRSFPVRFLAPLDQKPGSLYSQPQLAAMDPTTPDMKIRQVLDHWRQVGPIDIARHMQYVPPIETDSSVDPKLVRLTSGIDCLAQLLRHLASHANDIHGYIEEVMVAEKSNPVLAYAWQPFERNQPWPDKDEMAAAVAQKMEVIKEMLDDPEPREVAYSFLGLSGSDIMWETYWSRPETSLFAKVIYQESTSGRWRARERTRYDLRCAAIHLDRTLNSSQTLQGAVNSSFGPHTGSDGLPEIRLAAGAEIARVFYRPSSGHSLPFGHLYEFDLPLGVPNLAEAMANATGTVPVRWRVHYRLFAVIRQSPVSLFRPQGPDYIRTYNHSGTKVDMHWKPSSIVNDTWSVEDDVPGVSYTLVYLKRAPLPGLVPSEFGVAAPASRILRTASSSRRPDGTRRTRRGKRAGASKDSSLPGTSPSTDPPASASTSAQTFPPEPDASAAPLFGPPARPPSGSPPRKRPSLPTPAGPIMSRGQSNLGHQAQFAPPSWPASGRVYGQDAAMQGAVHYPQQSIGRGHAQPPATGRGHGPTWSFSPASGRGQADAQPQPPARGRGRGRGQRGGQGYGHGRGPRTAHWGHSHAPRPPR